ncbi:MAG: hypothetical protein E7561_00060 [Ruminococcaceae bacterium]|nr:hypothetical protein [Oscillospiraceae bacterium]
MIGRVVCSTAGRDRGKFLVIVGFSGENPLVADGKERPITRPKLKNPKHLRKTNSILEVQQYTTDKSLRRALREFNQGSALEQEED